MAQGKWLKVEVYEIHSQTYLVELTAEEWEQYQNDGSGDLADAVMKRGIVLDDEFVYIETGNLRSVGINPESNPEYAAIIEEVIKWPYQR